MKLKAIVKDLSEVPSEFHVLYTLKGDQYELTGIEGMYTQANITRLENTLEHVRRELTDTKKALKLFDGLDAEEVRKQLDKLPELEELAKGNKPDEEKTRLLVEARVKQETAPLLRQLETVQRELSDATAKVDTYAKRETTRTIHDAIRESALKARVRPEAIDDALLYGERLFEVVEGRVTTRDQQGVDAGLTPDNWLTDMQAKRPHWFAESNGAGSRGAGGAGNGAKNPWTAENWNLTEQGRIVAADPEKADRLARAAGTTVGGLQPPAKA